MTLPSGGAPHSLAVASGWDRLATRIIFVALFSSQRNNVRNK